MMSKSLQVAFVLLALVTPCIAASLDGEGSAAFVASADPVAAGPWKAEMVFTVGKSGIAEGGGIGFYTPPTSWNPPPVDERHIRLVTTSGAKPEWKITDRGVLGWIIAITAHGGKLAPGDRIVFSYEVGQVQKYTQRNLLCKMESDVDGDGKFAMLGTDALPKINVVSGPARQIRIAAHQVLKPGQRFVAKSIVLDDLRNPLDSVYTGQVEIGLVGSEARVPFENNRAEFTLTAPAEPGIYHIHARGTGLKEVWLPIRVTDKDAPGIFWGQLHGHTGFSDGIETPDDYYTYGRDVAFLDLCAVNDHAERQDEDNKWTRTIAAARSFYKPGEFVTIAGYEWTTLGHRNVYFAETTDDLPLVNNAENSAPDYATFVAKLKASGKEVVVGYHTAHPVDFDNYDPTIHSLEEIHSMWGTSEYAGNPGWTKTRDMFVPMSSAQAALARGQKLGFVAGGDTHSARPGRCWFGSRWNILAHKEGIAAVLAPKLERRDVFDALKNRHTYAATGERILLVFSVNGHEMGDEFETNGPVTIHFEVGGTSELSQVDIIRDNMPIWSKYATGLKFEQEIKDESLTPGDHWYYLRVWQKSGDRAWSSPVYVKRT